MPPAYAERPVANADVAFASGAPASPSDSRQLRFTAERGSLLASSTGEAFAERGIFTNDEDLLGGEEQDGEYGGQQRFEKACIGDEVIDDVLGADDDDDDLV